MFPCTVMQQPIFKCHPLSFKVELLWNTIKYCISNHPNGHRCNNTSGSARNSAPCPCYFMCLHKITSQICVGRGRKSNLSTNKHTSVHILLLKLYKKWIRNTHFDPVLPRKYHFIQCLVNWMKQLFFFLIKTAPKQVSIALHEETGLLHT